MDYLLCGLVSDSLEKKIKQIRFEYDKNVLKQDIYLIISKAYNHHANVKHLYKFIQDCLKKVNAIKLEITGIQIVDNFLSALIEGNDKLDNLINNLNFKGKYFDSSDLPPFIPIIKSDGSTINLELIKEIEKSLINEQYFLRKLNLYFIHNDKFDKANEFQI